jgi:hypothetical protein
LSEEEEAAINAIEALYDSTEELTQRTVCLSLCESANVLVFHSNGVSRKWEQKVTFRENDLRNRQSVCEYVFNVNG